MAIYDFEDIVYPYDPANAKIENSWYFSNLAQYADTEYNLVLKPQSSSNLLEKSNDIYGWMNNDGYGCCYAFKLKNHYRISKVTADVRAISYNANEKVAISLQPIYLESPSTYIQATDYYAQRDNGAPEVVENRTTHITDNDWHTVEFPTYNLEIATHLNIYCPVRRSVEVKNIKIEGYKIIASPSGGAGSGYIGNSLLSNKKMVGYNVPTSSDIATKTETVNAYSESPLSDTPKAGNGHVRIKFLHAVDTYTGDLGAIVKTMDITHKQTTSWNNSDIYAPVNNLSSYFGTDYILVTQQDNGNYFQYFDGNEGYGAQKTTRTGCIMYVPIVKNTIGGMRFKGKFDSGEGSEHASVYVEVWHIVDNQMVAVPDSRAIFANNSDWQEKEVTFTPSEVDYVSFYSTDGKWHFKDFEFI